MQGQENARRRRSQSLFLEGKASSLGGSFFTRGGRGASGEVGKRPEKGDT